MNKTNIRYLITLSLIVLLLFSLRYWALGPSNLSMIKTNTIEEFKQQEKDNCGLCDGVCLDDLNHCDTKVPKLTASSDCNTLIQKQPFTLKLKNTNYYLGFSSPDSDSTVFINRTRKRDNAQKWELIGVFDSKSSGCEYFIRSVSNPDDESVPNYYLSADKDHNLFVSTYGMGSNQKWQIDTTNGTIMTTKYKRYLGAIKAKGSRKVYLQCKPLPKESNWILEFDSSPDESSTTTTATTATEIKESFDNIVSILSNKNPGLRDTRWNGLWIYNNTTPKDMYMINLDSTQESSNEKELNEKNFLKLELLNGKGTITTYERDQSGVLSQSPSLWNAELVLGNSDDGTDDVLYANQRDGTDKLVGYTVNTDSIKDSKDPNASYIKLVRYNKDGKDISSLCVNPYNKKSSSTKASANIDSLCKKVSSDRIISSRDFNEIMGIKRTDYKKLINLPNITKDIKTNKFPDIKSSINKKDNRIRYGDRVVIARTSDNNKTDNCGWYGCRVAKLENDKPYKMLFQHGDEAPNAFYFRVPVGGNKKDGDIIKYGDKVVITQTSENNNTSNCGWYGCRVASMEGKTASDSYMKFGHGNEKPQSFYIRPPINDTKRDGQAVNYDDNIIISQTSENSKTDNCGWYGCRVASVQGTKEKDSYMSFEHGGDNPKEFYLRKKVSSETINSSRDFNEIMGLKKTDYKKSINLPNITKDIISKKISDVKSSINKKDCRIRYGDRVVIARTSDNNKTDNCGWYGCRVAKLENDKPYKMLFQHGDEAPNAFYFRVPVGGNKKDGDIIKYGDKVVITQTSENNNTSNCGWYGCRVASMEGKTASDSYMKFGHGDKSPQSFYIRPPINDTKRDGQAVNYDDNIIISQTSENSKTDNCGWYGCRVASIKGSKASDSYMSFEHGGDNPKEFYLRKMVGKECR